MNIDSFKDYLPKNKRHFVTDETIELIEKSFTDETQADLFKENLITYTSLFGDTSYSLTHYINAVKFCTLRLLAYTNVEAYKRTFPDKFEGRPDDEIKRNADGYARNKLVKGILEQAFIPSYLINQPLFQDALNTACRIMKDENVSPMTRVNAAKVILEYTKAPEIQKMQLEVGLNPTSELKDLIDTMHNYAEAQQNKIINGEATVTEIAETHILTSNESLDDE